MKDDHSHNENKWKKVAENTTQSEPEELEELEAPAEAPAIDYSSRDDLEAQLNTLETKYNEAVTALRYTQAEMENLRKRAERDVSNAYKYGPEKLINELLVVVDSLEKSLELISQPTADITAVREGIELTYKMLINVLEKFSVKQVNPEGESFNPTWHEAMTMQQQEGAKSGTVLSVLQKGYTLHERLLRPALVIVAK